MSDVEATTTVEVVLRGRPATIRDLREALEVLDNEGIPDSFEITVRQSEDRVYEEGVPHVDRKVEHVLRVSAERGARWVATAEAKGTER